MIESLEPPEDGEQLKAEQIERLKAQATQEERWALYASGITELMQGVELVAPHTTVIDSIATGGLFVFGLSAAAAFLGSLKHRGDAQAIDDDLEQGP